MAEQGTAAIFLALRPDGSVRVRLTVDGEPPESGRMPKHVQMALAMLQRVVVEDCGIPLELRNLGYDLDRWLSLSIGEGS